MARRFSREDSEDPYLENHTRGSAVRHGCCSTSSRCANHSAKRCTVPLKSAPLTLDERAQLSGDRSRLDGDRPCLYLHIQVLRISIWTTSIHRRAHIVGAADNRSNWIDRARIIDKRRTIRAMGTESVLSRDSARSKLRVLRPIPIEPCLEPYLQTIDEVRRRILQPLDDRFNLCSWNIDLLSAAMRTSFRARRLPAACRKLGELSVNHHVDLVEHLECKGTTCLGMLLGRQFIGNALLFPAHTSSRNTKLLGAPPAIMQLFLQPTHLQTLPPLRGRVGGPRRLPIQQLSSKPPVGWYNCRADQCVPLGTKCHSRHSGWAARPRRDCSSHTVTGQITRSRARAASRSGISGSTLSL